MRSNSRPVISMITKTIDRVSGTAAATTRPTRKPRAIRLISMTTARATKNLSMNSSTARRMFLAWSETFSTLTPSGNSALNLASSACRDLSRSRPLKCLSMITPSISAGSP
ncbi:hypothetical protein D3C85_1096210 [compost metagenome]